MSKWISDKNGGFSLALGQILELCIKAEGESYRDENGYWRHKSDPHLYRVYLTNPDYVYGEGTCIQDDPEFEFSADGLQAAKKRAVEFARELLTEALVSLDQVEVVGDE